jgi:hypothetical protein
MFYGQKPDKIFLFNQLIALTLQVQKTEIKIYTKLAHFDSLDLSPCMHICSSSRSNLR